MDMDVEIRRLETQKRTALANGNARLYAESCEGLGLTYNGIEDFQLYERGQADILLSTQQHALPVSPRRTPCRQDSHTKAMERIAKENTDTIARGYKGPRSRRRNY